MTQGHPHAKVALEYWTIALTDPEPWKRLQFRTCAQEDWQRCTTTPSFYREYEYRIIPTMLSINGYEFPEPLRVAPALDTGCWLSLTHYDDLAVKFIWAKSGNDLFYLRRGRIHLTREAAEAHSRADILAAGGEV